MNGAGHSEFLYSTPLVLGKAKSGVNLLIPTFEIFRTFYAGCSDLALALLSGSFRDAQQKLGKVEMRQFDGLNALHVELTSGVKQIAVR